MKRLNKELRRLAQKKGISVQRISEKIGCTRWTVYRWYNGYDISPAYQSIVEQVCAELKGE